MGLFSRLRRRTGPPSAATGASGTRYGEDRGGRQHLDDFVRTRTGVEAFIEPATTVTPTTVLLVAQDGEWTRRPAPGPDAVRDFARHHAIGVYDVNLVGYPQRMRDWNARRKAAGA